MDYGRRNMPITGKLGGLGTHPLFDKESLPRLSVILAIILVSCAWPIFAAAASIADGTLWIPDRGRGLLTHYGFQASLVAAPLVLLTTYFAVSYFIRLLRSIDQIIVPDEDLSKVVEIIKPHIDSIFLRKKYAGMLAIFMFVGASIWVFMFRKLDAPWAYWGNDVFNAAYYRYGYVAGNAFFFWLWAIIYPIGIFYALHLTISMEIIVAKLQNNKLLRLKFLHDDECAGMSKFGTLNFIVMLINFWPLATIAAYHFTHRFTYFSLIVGSLAISALFILQSVYGIYCVSRTIKHERKAMLRELDKQITKSMHGSRKSFAAAGATLQYRDCVMAISSIPYSGSIAAAVNVVRFAPGALAVIKFFHG
jgi:hypothetical protein